MQTCWRILHWHAILDLSLDGKSLFRSCFRLTSVSGEAFSETYRFHPNSFVTLNSASRPISDKDGLELDCFFASSYPCLSVRHQHRELQVISSPPPRKVIRSASSNLAFEVLFNFHVQKFVHMNALEKIFSCSRVLSIFVCAARSLFFRKEVVPRRILNSSTWQLVVPFPQQFSEDWRSLGEGI